MAKKPKSREDAIILVGQFMQLDDLAHLDFFICGSIRRGKEQVGDADLIVVGDFAKGEGQSTKYKTSGGPKMKNFEYKGMQINMWRSSVEALGSALLYATGSGQFNQYLRKIAINKKMKLSQYGLFERYGDKKLLVAETEKEILNLLGYKFIPPSYRVSYRIRVTMDAFRKRSDTDLSYMEPLIGRVHKRSIYTKKQRLILPVDYSIPDIKEGIENMNLLLPKVEK